MIKSFFKDSLKNFDSKCFDILERERKRQKETISMIASESFTSKAILEATGSVLTNKYAEGYPGARYYSGCNIVDEAEELAINTAKELFEVPYANVQPLSGSNANLAVYSALLGIRDSVLAMDLNSGGHLTHGSKVSLTSKIYSFHHYGVDESGLINYDEVKKKAYEIKPKMIVAGCSAYSGIVDWSYFRKIADEVGAVFFADIAHYSGLIAAKQYPSPANIADVCAFTTHKTIMGPKGACIISKDESIGKKISKALFPGIQGGPQMHAILGKAIAFRFAKTKEFIENAKNIIKNAKIIAEIAKSRGYDIYGKSTECHMILLNVSKKGLNGQDAADGLEEVGIICNKNMVPNDVNKFKCSGIRLGTVSTTTIGFSNDDHHLIGNLIFDILDSKANKTFDSKLAMFKKTLSNLVRKSSSINDKS